MLRFWKETLIFSCILVAVIVGVDQLYRHIVHPDLAIVRTWEQFTQRTENPQIIFLGDSHMKTGIDPRYIPDSFNLASSGEGYIENYYTLNYVLDVLAVHPEVIVLPLDVHSLSAQRTEQIGIDWFWIKRVPLWQLAQELPSVPFVKTQIMATFPSIGRGYELLNHLLHPPAQSEIRLGFEARKGDFSKKAQQEIAIKRIEQQFGDFADNDPYQILYLEKILKRTQQENIQVLFIQFPMSDAYAQAYSVVHGDFVQRQAALRDMVQENFVDIYIAAYPPADPGEEHLYADSDHLNETGAALLSTHLAQQLQRL